TSFDWVSKFGFFGFRSAAIVPPAGTSSCSSPSRFASNSAAITLMPVALPPGRLSGTINHPCQHRKSPDLFDHLVGARDQRRRDIEAEGSRGGQIDDGRR